MQQKARNWNGFIFGQLVLGLGATLAVLIAVAVPPGWWGLILIGGGVLCFVAFVMRIATGFARYALDRQAQAFERTFTTQAYSHGLAVAAIQDISQTALNNGHQTTLAALGVADRAVKGMVDIGTAYAELDAALAEGTRIRRVYGRAEVLIPDASGLRYEVHTPAECDLSAEMVQYMEQQQQKLSALPSGRK